MMCSRSPGRRHCRRTRSTRTSRARSDPDTGQSAEFMEPFDLPEASIAQAAAAFATRTVSVPELTGELLARIDRLDRGPVALRSVLEANPDAMTAAAALQEELGRTGV